MRDNPCLTVGRRACTEAGIMTSTVIEATTLLLMESAWDFYQHGHFHQALELLDEVLKDEPAHYEAGLLRANILYRWERSEEAIESLRYMDQTPEVRVLMGWSMLMAAETGDDEEESVGQNELTRALRHLEEALKFSVRKSRGKPDNDWRRHVRNLRNRHHHEVADRLEEFAKAESRGKSQTRASDLASNQTHGRRQRRKKRR